MNKYQKIAALVIRLASVIWILYLLSTVVSALFVMPHAVTLAIPSLVVGVLVYLAAFPLAAFATFGIQE